MPTVFPVLFPSLKKRRVVVDGIPSPKSHLQVRWLENGISMEEVVEWEDWAHSILLDANAVEKLHIRNAWTKYVTTSPMTSILLKSCIGWDNLSVFDLFNTEECADELYQLLYCFKATLKEVSFRTVVVYESRERDWNDVFEQLRKAQNLHRLALDKLSEKPYNDIRYDSCHVDQVDESEFWSVMVANNLPNVYALPLP
jgi:hypothetical protein